MLEIKSPGRYVERLAECRRYIRRELARTINMRNTPEITFILDQSIEYGVNMSKMIDDLTKKGEE